MAHGVVSSKSCNVCVVTSDVQSASIQQLMISRSELIERVGKIKLK